MVLCWLPLSYAVHGRGRLPAKSVLHSTQKVRYLSKPVV
jgi:hypothetical protein